MPASFRKKKVEDASSNPSISSSENISIQSSNDSIEKNKIFENSDLNSISSSTSTENSTSNTSTTGSESKISESSLNSKNDNYNKFIPGLSISLHSEKLINESIEDLISKSLDPNIRNSSNISLFIDNLPPSVYDSELLKILTYYNMKVSSIYIPIKKNSYDSNRLYGFVRAPNIREAAQIKLLLDNALFKNYRLSVTLAKESQSSNSEKRSHSLTLIVQQDLSTSISQNIKRIKQVLSENESNI